MVQQHTLVEAWIMKSQLISRNCLIIGLKVLTLPLTFVYNQCCSFWSVKMKPISSQSQTLHGLFKDAAEQYKSNTALVAENCKGTDEVAIDYGTLSSLSTKLAEEIKKHVEKDNQVIGVFGEEFHKVLIALLGILQVPAAFTFLPRKSPEKRTISIMSSSEVSLIVICEDISQIKFLQTAFHMSTEKVIVEEKSTKASFSLVRLVPFLSPLNHLEQFPVPIPLAYVVFTSGTTGDPKVVKVPHRCIVPNILHLRDTFGVRPSDVVFNAAPLTFDPSIIEIFLALSSGAKLVAVSDQTKLLPNKLVPALEKHRVTILQITPSLLFRVDHKSLRSTILSNNTALRILAFGGEPFPSLSMLSECRHPNNKTEIYNLYGITEVSSWASIYQLKRNRVEPTDTESVPLGDPLLETILEVRDEHDVALTEGEGQLFIGSDTRVCYIGSERHTDVEPVFRATGDYVKLTPSGLFFLGRKDDQVKRFGKRVNLSEIAKIIESFPDVLSCKAVLDESWKPFRLYAFYIPTGPLYETKSFQETEEGWRLKVRLRDHMLAEALPDYIFTLDSFPVTHHGKLNTENLKTKAREYLRECSRIKDLTTEQIVKGHIKETLSITGEVDMSKSFVELGGNSLQVVSFAEELERSLKNTDFELLDCILHKSIGEVISQVNKTAGYSSLPTSMEKPEIKTNAAPLDNECSMGNKKRAHKLLEHKEMNAELVLAEKESKTEELEERLPGEEDLDNVSLDHRKRRKLGHGGNFVKRSTVMRRGTASAMDTSVFTSIQSMADKGMLSIRENWSFDLEKCIDATPLVVKRERAPHVVAFIGSHSGLFVSLDVDTGLKLWQVRLPDRIESSPCMSACETLVIVGCYNHNVYFFHQTSGTIYWVFQTLGPVKSSPVSDPATGLVYVGSHDGIVYALQPEVKRCQWSVSDGDGSMFSSPCVDSQNNCVFAASLSGKLLCITKESGVVKWYYQCPKPLFSSPEVTADGGVALGCVDGYIYHLNCSGELVNRILTEAPVFSSPCVVTNRERETILIGSHDGCLYSIDLSCGEISWRAKIGEQIYSTPSCIYKSIDSQPSTRIGSIHQAASHEATKSCSTIGLVCCCSTDGNLAVLDLTNGKNLISHSLPGEIFSSPLFMEDQTIIVGCRNDKIYSFSLNTG